LILWLSESDVDLLSKDFLDGYDGYNDMPDFYGEDSYTDPYQQDSLSLQQMQENGAQYRRGSPQTQHPATVAASSAQKVSTTEAEAIQSLRSSVSKLLACFLTGINKYLHCLASADSGSAGCSQCTNISHRELKLEGSFLPYYVL
jgi:hypothetical protein